MTERIQISSRSGATIDGALALPAGNGSAGAVIVIHEWFGLNDDIRAITERLAGDGFVALAVDLYRGEVATEPQRAMQLVSKLQTREAMDDITGAVGYLRGHPRVNGRIGITGFCVGGAMALAAACNVEGLAAVVPFYGLPQPQYTDWTQVTAPIEGHYGAQDGSIPAAKVEAVRAALAASGKPASFHFYEAGHAFMRRGGPSYREPIAEEAWSRMVAFFRAHLA